MRRTHGWKNTGAGFLRGQHSQPRAEESSLPSVLPSQALEGKAHRGAVQSIVTRGFMEICVNYFIKIEVELIVPYYPLI